MGKKSNQLLGFLAAVALWATSGNTAFSDNHSLAQRMLLTSQQMAISQQMAKASCFIGTYSNVNQNIQVLRDNPAQFDENTYLLLFGDYDLGLGAVETPELKDKIRNTLPAWKLMKFAADLTVAMPEIPGLDIDLMADISNKLHGRFQDVLTQLKSNDTSLAPYLNTVVHMAELGVLIQKSAKEFCYVSYGLNAKENLQKLSETITRFDTSIDLLIKGDFDKNIIAAPTSELDMRLQTIQGIWKSIRARYQPVLEGKVSHSSDFVILARISDPLLIEINDTVRLFMDTYRSYKSEQPQ